jgi:hypothetical protein
MLFADRTELVQGISQFNLSPLGEQLLAFMTEARSALVVSLSKSTFPSGSPLCFFHKE